MVSGTRDWAWGLQCVSVGILGLPGEFGCWAFGFGGLCLGGVRWRYSQMICFAYFKRPRWLSEGSLVTLFCGRLWVSCCSEDAGLYF